MVVIPNSLKKKAEQEQKNRQQTPKNTHKTTTTTTATTKTPQANTFKVPESRKVTETPHVPTVLERYGAGNIDLTKRPQYKNEDGSVSTVLSIGIQDNGKEVVIPTIATDKNGKAVKLTNDEAVKRYYDTGEYLGKFDTRQEADSYAERLHQAQEKGVSPLQRGILPVQADNEYREIKDYYKGLVFDKPRKATLKDYTINSFKRGWNTNEYGKESANAMFGAKNYKKYYENLLNGDDYNFEPQGLLGEGISGAAEFLGQNANRLLNPNAWAAALGAGGAASIAGKAGPQALLPEEIITVPAAAAFGFKASGIYDMFKTEAGLAYNEMIQNGATPKTARNIATVVGTVNAALEMWQLDDLVKSFKILKDIDATKPLAKKIASFVLKRGTNIASETAQEMAQEAVTIAGANAASKIDKGKIENDWQEAAKRILETGKSSALSFAITGAMGDVTNYGINKTAETVDKTIVQPKKIGNQIVNQGGAIGAIDEGLGFGVNTDAYKNAQKLSQKIVDNKNISNYSIGKQAILNSEQSIETLKYNVADDLKTYGLSDTKGLAEAMTSLLAGEKISGKQVEIIAKSKEAVSLLEIYTGEDIETDTSISELKTQIKNLDTSQLIPSLFEISPQQRISDFAETLGDNGKNTITKFYNSGQNAEEYVREMANIYNAGQNNKEIPLTNTVNSAQARAMYQAGQVDKGKVSGYNVNNQNNTVKGAENYANSRGQNNRYGGERNGSGNTQRQVSEVEGDTRRNAQNRQTDIRPEGSESTTQEIHKVTAKSLGIKGGDSRNVVNLVADYEGKEEVEMIARRQDLKVVAFSGDNLSFTEDGEEFNARGAIEGGTMYIRTDSKEATAAQIAKHEATHDKVRKGQINLAQVKKRAYAASQGNIEVLERAYASAFAGLTADEIWEEIVCDSVANMNFFEYTYGRYSEKTGMLNQMVRWYAGESEKEIAKAKETRGSPTETAEFKNDAVKKAYNAIQNSNLYQDEQADDIKLLSELDKNIADAEKIAKANEGTQTDYNANAKIREYEEQAKVIAKIYEGKTKFSRSFDIPYNESTQLSEYIINKNNRMDSKIPDVDCTEIGNNFYVWQNIDKNNYKVIEQIGIEGNEDFIDFYRNEVSDNDGTTKGIWSMYDIFNERQRSRISSGVDVKEASTNGQNGGIYENKSRGDRRGNTEKGNGNKTDSQVKFSLAKPVEETKDLIAVHNLKPEALLKQLKLGGLPMPSIAITKAKEGYSKFGDISVVFDKETINPKNRQNKVYSGDAWTPTFPRLYHKANAEKASALRSLYYDLARKYGYDEARPLYNFQDTGMIQDFLDREGGEKQVIARLKDDTGLMQLFFLMKGEKAVDAIKETTLKTLSENEVKDYEYLINELGEDFKLAKGFGKDSFTREQFEKAAEKLYKEVYGIDDSGISNIKRNKGFILLNIGLRNYVNNGITQRFEKVDTEATNKAIREKAEKLNYDEWVEKTFSGIAERQGIYNGKDPYTPRGDRRSFDALHYEVNLENIVKAMRQQGEQGIGIFGYNSIMGAATKQYGSIDEIREDAKNRMTAIPESEYDEKRSEFQDRLYSIAKTAAKMDDFQHIEAIEELLVEAVSKSKTEDGIANYLKKEMQGWAKYSDKIPSDLVELVSDIQQMPTEYFEAKPQRAVELDEIRAVIMPEQSGYKTDLTELRSELDKNNIPIVEYAYGDDEARTKALNSVEGVKFSRVNAKANAEYLTAVEKGDTEKAQAMVADAAKAWGAITDEDGNPKVVYHGTHVKGFNIFNRGEGALGKGIYFAESYEYAKGMAFSEEPYRVYLNIKNPFEVDYPGNYDMQKLIEQGYDGIHHKPNGFWVAFNPAQIKSAEAVTYDENGKVIPLSKRFSDSEDIRFSRVASTYEEIRHENEDLRKELAETKARLRAKTVQAEYWKGETRETAPNERTVVQKTVKKVASDYIKDYNINAKYMSREEIEKRLTELAEYVWRADVETDTSYNTLINKAYELASDMVDSCETINTEKEERYRNIKSYFKNTTLKISDKEDIIDYNEFRKRMFGKMNLSLQNGTPIDKIWSELGDMYGKDLFPEEIINPTDQILQCASVLNDLSDIYENPHEQFMDMAKEELAIDVVSKILSGVIEPKTTISDKRRAQYSDRIIRLKNTLKQVRERRDENYTDLYNSFKDYRENVKDKQLNQQLLRIMRRLQNKKLPTPNRSVQEEYAKEINRAIGEFNLSVEKVTPQREARMYEIAQRVAELQNEYPEYQPDNATTKWLNMQGKKTVSELSVEEKRELIGILLALEHDIDTYNKFLGISEWRTTHEAGQQVMRDVRNAHGGFEDAFMAKTVFGILRPDAAIKTIVGYNHDNPLYQAFLNYQNGETEMIRYGIEASAMFERFEGKDKAYPQYKDFYKKISGKDAEHIAIVGTELVKEGDGNVEEGRKLKIDITPAMRMSIYMHSLNRQNLRHMLEGGLQIPNINSEAYKNGKMREAYQNMPIIKLSLVEIRRIITDMTVEERAYCRVMQEYFDTMSKPRINEVSLKLFGVEKASVDNYYPISVVNSFRFEDLGAVQRDGSVTGMGGRLNERIDSSKPIYLFDANDVVKQNVLLHSRFVGLAIPYRDMNKLWNVQNTGLIDSEMPSAISENTKSVAYIDNIKKAVSDRWTVSANDYVDDLMRIYNQGVSDRSGWDTVFSNYQKARIAKNLAVSVKQAASFPTASAEVGHVAVLKAAGYAVTHFSKSSIENQRALLQNTRYQYRLGKNKMDYDKTDIDVVQAVDTWTVAHLLPAAEFYVREYHSDLKIGSDEYDAKVQEVFDNIIMKTQPNYTPLQRPAFLRSKNPITRAINIFKTQPYQNFNILYDAVCEYKAAKRAYNYYRNTDDAIVAKKTKQKYDTAKKRLAWAVTSQISASFVYALMQYLVDFIRSKRKPNALKKYQDIDKKMNVLSVSKGILKNMFTNFGGTIPLGNEFVNIFKAGTDAIAKQLDKEPIFDEYTYDLEMPVFSMLNSLSDDITKILTATPEIIGNMAKGDDIDWLQVKKVYGNAIISALELKSGMPIKNITNFADTVISWFRPQKEGKKKK